jgi:hypothetical protein
VSNLNRRQLLQTLSAAPAAFVCTWTAADVAQAAEGAARARQAAAAGQSPYAPRFFTAAEFAAVVALADMILPADARSVSASAAGAPEFIDYIVAEQADRQTALRGGLAWLDTECRRRFDKVFTACTDAERRQVLDDIAYPARTRPELRHGAAFFTTMRDLVATGFWSSRIGIEDLGYMGNRPTAWTGPPTEVLRKLGLPEGN